MASLFTATLPEFPSFGTNALQAFRNACELSIISDPRHAVFYRLLADHADRLLDDYHQAPLATSQASEDFHNLKELIAIAEAAFDQPLATQFEAANTIASKDYF